MSKFASVLLSATIIGATSQLLAQQAANPSGQALIGMAVRSTPRAGSSYTGGFEAIARVGLPLLPGTHLVAEGSLIRFGDEVTARAVTCPVGLACLPALRSAPGLGMAGVAAGLQPRLRIGSIELRATGSVGGYWLYHHDPSLSGFAPALRGGLGLGLPVGDRLRVLLEASALHLLTAGSHDANSRHFGFGFGIN